jgi:signal transduction histidine kinase
LDRAKWFLHPVLILVISIVALGSSLIFYIYWYIEVSDGLKSVVQRFNLDSGKMLTAQTWVVILVLSLLVGLILIGMLIIFIYSQKMVQLYRLQRNFINNFTHELKTPVASLNLFLETFQKYDLERKDQLKYIDYMLSDVKRLSVNINRILNLARIESKSYMADFSWLNPVDFINRFVKKNRYLFPNCRIDITDHPKSPAYLRINPSLFDILLMNLITNAVKYNASGNPTMDISIWPRKKKLYFQFKDNGIGFEQRHRKKIFKKFYQIGQSDDMSARGSGVGLYLALSIAKIHKGTISAVSKGPGQGATFMLTMPLPEKKSR